MILSGRKSSILTILEAQTYEIETQTEKKEHDTDNEIYIAHVTAHDRYKQL